MKRHWRSLGLSTRATHCLAAHKIKSKADLAIVPDSDLLRIANFGRVTLKEVRAVTPYHPAKSRGEKQRLKAILATFWNPETAPTFTPPKVAILRHPGDPLSTSETGTTYHQGIYWPRHGN